MKSVACYPVQENKCLTAVRDVTWMSDQSVHLAEWMAPLEQVTVRHLAKCTQIVPNP